MANIIKIEIPVDERTDEFEFGKIRLILQEDDGKIADVIEAYMSDYHPMDLLSKFYSRHSILQFRVMDDKGSVSNKLSIIPAAVIIADVYLKLVEEAKSKSE